MRLHLGVLLLRWLGRSMLEPHDPVGLPESGRVPLEHLQQLPLHLTAFRKAGPGTRTRV
jgi:hypothetical protein